MPMLDTITDPLDLQLLTGDELQQVAQEIRSFLVETVCRHGGHLGPNLGAVELTIAVHRVFRSPGEPIVFDTGHQAYVHKLLTGRRNAFTGLREHGGLSGYPNRTESKHDLVENSHASTALAYAEGLGRSSALDGSRRPVVAVVGDGALTGGLAWEALNNLAVSPAWVVVTLNDNGRSYAPTVGGVAAHLAALRRGDARENLFTALGLAYVGPVDGHDITVVERALREARALGRTVVVHCVTGKGRGYRPAEDDEADLFHTVGVLDPATGLPASAPARTWTDEFADELVALGETRPDLIAVSAAMLGPTGLRPFARRFPARTVDVGIAEQHAVTSAAGLAMAGRHPVVAIYSTFLNRAFDQVLLDVALHRLPVTFVLDRAGITGPDGPSHHGMWDLAALGPVPGLRVAAPRDATTLREELREAVAIQDGPTVLRYPKATTGPDIPAIDHRAGVDVLYADRRARVLIVAVGPMAGPAVAAAGRLGAAGVGCTVVDPRWVQPVHPGLVRLAADHELVVTVEDGIRVGGVGAALARTVTDLSIDTPVHVLGLPAAFLPQGGRAQLLAEYGLDCDTIAGSVLDRLGDVPRPVGRPRRPRQAPGSGPSGGVLPATHRHQATATRDRPTVPAATPARRPEDVRASENFPVALRVLPAATRRDLLALYAYARYVDDLGDEPPGPAGDGSVAARLAALDAVDAGVRDLYAGRPVEHPVLRRLAATVHDRDLPMAPLLRLVEANRVDQRRTEYRTFADLVAYCELSANPVGELVLHVFGQADPERVALSDRICTALQLVEHLQDVAEDQRRGRVYLPVEDLDRFGVRPGELSRPPAGRTVRALVAFEAERAAAWLESGAPLVATLRGWGRLAVSGYLAGGRAALDALARAGYDPVGGPPKAGRRDVLRRWVLATVRSAG